MNCLSKYGLALLTMALLLSLFAVATATTTNTVGGSTSYGDGIEGYISFEAITASASGTLSSIGVNVEAPTGNIIVGIYSTYSGSTLSGLLGQSASTAVASTGWIDPTVSGVTIVSGTTYYIAWEGSGYLSFYYVGSGSEYQSAYSYGTLPSSIAMGSTNTETINMRIIINDSPTPTPTPVPTATPTPTPTATPTPSPSPTPSPTATPTPASTTNPMSQYAHTGSAPIIGNIDALWYFLIVGIVVFCLFYIAKKAGK